ncbi:DsbA oxidoreductase [Proteiniborus sp. DW1]|nr:DsbA oxidoreductase [Proteiniborus sp. DW1]
MDLFTVYPKEYVVNSLNYLSRLGRDFGIEFNNLNGEFNTRRAHLAEYYAKEHNKYDEYSKIVFKAYFGDKLNIADKNILNEIAKSIGLDVDDMNNSIDSNKYDKRLIEDYNLASKYHFSSVPTFIINDNIRISGIKEYNEFKKTFLEAIQ